MKTYTVAVEIEDADGTITFPQMTGVVEDEIQTEKDKIRAGAKAGSTITFQVTES